MALSQTVAVFGLAAASIFLRVPDISFIQLGTDNVQYNLNSRPSLRGGLPPVMSWVEEFREEPLYLLLELLLVCACCYQATSKRQVDRPSVGVQVQEQTFVLSFD